jgi:hypothetical protein
MIDRPEQSKKASAGVFSSARHFFLPIGRAIDPAGVRGYPIDMRVKTVQPLERLVSGEPHAGRLYVDDIQWGIGAFERFVLGEGEEWLHRARRVGDHLCQTQDRGGGWTHPFPARHTWRLVAGWLSGMAQGEAASLLVRLAIETGVDRFGEAAIAALKPFLRRVGDGGVRAALGSGWLAEEYPTMPASYVLNGAIFAIWGMRDVAVGLTNAEAQSLYDEAETHLVENLWRWDLGWWSRYSLYPHPLLNVASSFYHDLHIAQLRAMSRLRPRPELDGLADRFERYTHRRANRSRAFAKKAAFRLAVPRNRHLAFRMPWFRRT